MNARNAHRLCPLVVALALSVLLISCGHNAAPAADQDQEPGVASTEPWIIPSAAIPGIDQQVVGDGAEMALILKAKGESAKEPIAVYFHSWGSFPPNARPEPLEALVSAGFTVIYPAYQDIHTEEDAYLDNAVAGVRSALAEIAEPQGALVALGPNVGGALAFDLAAVAEQSGFPPVTAAVAISPGRSPRGEIPRPDYGQIPSGTRLLAVEVPGDSIPGVRAESRRMLKLATRVQSSHKQIRRMPLKRGASANEGGFDWAPAILFLTGEIPIGGSLTEDS